MSRSRAWVAALLVVQLGLSSLAQAQGIPCPPLVRRETPQDIVVRKRVQAFARMPDAQRRRLLAAADRRKAAAEAHTDRLVARYDANDVELSARVARFHAGRVQLDDSFAVARRVAKQSLTPLSLSLTSVQLPEREAFLRRLATSEVRPSVRDLEQLWSALLAELVQSGEVVRLETSVLQDGGAARETEVVRVGPFTASSADGFLVYLPAQKQLAVVPHPAPARFGESGADLRRARGERYVRAPIDPSRGLIVSLYPAPDRPWSRLAIAAAILGLALIAALSFFYANLPLRRGR